MRESEGNLDNEPARRASEEQLKQLFDASPVAMAVTSGEEDRVDAINDKFTELFGYTIEDVPDVAHWWPLAYPDEKYRQEIKSLWEAKIEQAQTGKDQLEPVEATVTCKDGSQRYVEFRLSFVGDRRLVTFVDLTERKQTEEKLQEREKHSQSLLQLSQKLERSQTYAEVLNAARDEVRNIIGYQNLWVYLISEDKKSFKALIAGGPISEAVMSEAGVATLPIKGDKMLEEIAKARGIIVVEDARTDERTNKEIVAQLGNRTIVNVPITLMGRHLGSMGTGTFGDEEGVRVPSPSEQEYLSALASHMAVTLDRLHLLAERKQAEEERRAHLQFFESMDQVNRAIQGTNDLGQMMSDVLDVLLKVFECDRAWLVYPCDPKATVWSVPMERTRPEYPGVLPIGVELPLTPPGAAVFQILREANGPVKFGPGLEHEVAAEMTKFFSVKSYIAMALYPKISKPWSFGLHQCSYTRVWTANEERLFQEIGRRIADALTSLLSYRNLQESEERYRMLFNVMDEGVAINEVIRDEQGDVIDYTVVDVNPAFTKNSIFRREQILGKQATSLYHMSPEFIRDWWRKHSDMQEVVHTEMHYPPTDRWFHITTTPPAGNRFVTISVDITERKRAEEALREGEERYRLLVNLSPDAIGIYGQEGIVFVNPAAVQMLGAISEADLIGRSIFDFIDSSRHAAVKEFSEQTHPSNEPAEFMEEKLLRFDGSSFNAEVAGVPFRYQGQDYVQFVARDVTERKQHEREHEAIIIVSTALRQATTRNEILGVILDQSLGLFEADGAVLVLDNPQTGGYINAMGRGEVGERFSGLNIPFGQGISSWVIANRTSYLNNSAHRDSLFYRADLLDDSHCVAASPLIAQEQVFGALWVARKHKLTDQDLRLLNAITDIAGNAIRRVRLHEQTEEQLRHLIALHQIDLAISTNFDLDITLRVILNHVKDELDVDAAGILLLDPVSHTLDYAAGIGFRTGGIEQSHVRLGNEAAGRAALEYHIVSYSDLRRTDETFGRSGLFADEGFVSHYAAPLLFKGQVKGVLELFHRKTFEPSSEWMSYFETLATQAAIAIESASLFENLQRSNMELTLAYDATIEGWSRALDLRDKETEGHTQRVTDMVLDLAEKMRLGDTEKLDLRRGALLHDIGKMGVPDSILLKPGPLTESEMETMRQHPTYAYQMLSPIAYLKHALEIPYCHHEKWDGSGYPRGLKGEEIPLSARMFAIVDVFDALTPQRPYRAAWTVEEVYRYILEESGKHFDPQVVKVFLETR